MSQKNRQPWDFGKFVETLSYFEVIPLLNWVQELFQGRPQDSQNKPDGDKKVGVILVAGATGGVGKRVVKSLLEKGYRVRSLVRDIEKARAILGNDTELVVADITKIETLTPLVMANIQAVICCTAVRVQPVEGDTPDREKYNQGVKFYQPEIVGDTPENVEYQGVKNLVDVAAKYLPQADVKTIFDFTQSSVNPNKFNDLSLNNLKNIWGALDDVVMGGVSSSNMIFTDNVAIFTGNVSTDNSGGFASVRTKNFQPSINLSGYEGIELRIQGDGKRYKLFVRTDSAWDGVGYSYSFDTVDGAWINVRIPFADLIPVFRAKVVKNCPAIDQSRVCSLQLMLSKFEYDGQLNPHFSPGTFALKIESIAAYGGHNLSRFVLVSSAGVTRPGRAGINLEEEPPAVRLNDQLGGILTWKLKGEDSLRESGISYTIIRPCALTEEAGGKELILEQGDNIRGKISRDDIAELCVQALQNTQACNVTFEVKATENSANHKNWENLFAGLETNK
ncbi:NADH:ubiquinone oxidoreductase complex I intermediate-associated protein 30 [Calothrix sp. NIES-4101]|nr:NADH:ubiquinone oxidoreductase complex I intermediate-associated protein 30 [Calothrix sp. NIES-4101]